MINTCCDIGYIPDIKCDSYAIPKNNLHGIPDNYRLILNMVGWCDIPMDELLPGNKYATKQLIRVTLIQ